MSLAAHHSYKIICYYIACSPMKYNLISIMDNNSHMAPIVNLNNTK